MKLTIILPVFNRAEKTKHFLKCLLNQEIEKLELRIVVINDGSTDQTGEVLDFYSKYLNLIVINTSDKWWGGSINLGLDWIRDNALDLDQNSFLALANNDVFFDSSFIQNIFRELAHLPDGFFHPLVCNHEGKLVSSHAKLVSWFPFITLKEKPNNKNLSVDFMTARFLIGRQGVFNVVGKIPVELIHYQGDYFLTYKAKLLGLKNTVLVNVQVNLDDAETGLKSDRITTLDDLWNSFFTVKSSNNLKHRWVFIRQFNGGIFSFFILASMVINIFGRFLVAFFKTKKKSYQSSSNLLK